MMQLSREQFFEQLQIKVEEQFKCGTLDFATTERYFMTINRIDGGPISRHFADNPVAQSHWVDSVREMQARYGFTYGFLTDADRELRNTESIMIENAEHDPTEKWAVCPACKGKGTGQGDNTYCGHCGGDGTISPIEVSVP